MLRPLLGISEPDLERELLRKSVGALAAGRHALRRLRAHAAGRRARAPLGADALVCDAVPAARAGRRPSARDVVPPLRARAHGAPAPRRRLTIAAAAGSTPAPWIPSPSRSRSPGPREEVFEYLADIANHAEFTDHFMVDWRLTREDSYGRGAGARFRVKAPLQPLPVGRRRRSSRSSRRGRIVEAGRDAASSTASARSASTSSSRRPAARRACASRFETEPEDCRPTSSSRRSARAAGSSARTARRCAACARSSRRTATAATRPTVAGGARKPATGVPIRCTAATR